jgi:hypothetical protein
MKPLRGLSLAFAGMAACTDYNLQGPEVHEGSYNPPDLGAEYRTDSITQVTVPAVDVLWVIDNSGSMEEEQTKLKDSFGSFMEYFTDSGLDYHVGVVSTDMFNPQESGRLVQDDDKADRYIDTTYSREDAIKSFRQRASLGVMGSGDEMGTDAAYTALVDLRYSVNDGFYRDEATLSIVVISDERNQSQTSANEFSSWMLGLKAEEGMVSFSSIVGLSNNDCIEAERGTGYLEVTDTVGGIAYSICEADWADVLTELGLQAAGLKREFFLTLAPVESTIAVSVTTDGDTVDYQAGTDWSYDRTRNSVTFAEIIPEPLAVVTVTYEVLASVGNPAEEGEGEATDSGA